MDSKSFVASTSVLGLDLSPEQVGAFSRFEEALYAANEVMNLTRVPREEAWLRHFVDSLLIQELLPEGADVLDLGSGPGLPAWPLACARPDLRVTALDSNKKMLGFLRTQPLPNLRVVQVRAEEWGMREVADVVTGRAIAPLSAQLELSAAFCRIGGIVVPMRTPADGEAIEGFHAQTLGLVLETTVTKELPGTDVVRLLPVYRKVAATAQRYPRRWAEMKAKPL